MIFYYRLACIILNYLLLISASLIANIHSHFLLSKADVEEFMLEQVVDASEL